MRKKGRENPNWNDTSWTDFVNWDSFVDKIPMAISFGKGTVPIKKTVYLIRDQLHMMEEIRERSSHLFRTETDLTRSMMNTALRMYYHIFVKGKGSEDQETAFFYKSVKRLEHEWKIADASSTIKDVIKTCSEKRRKGFMTAEKEKEIVDSILKSLPPEWSAEVLDTLKMDGTALVYEIARSRSKEVYAND